MSYGVQKGAKAISKGNFHNGGIKVWILIYYNYGGRNRTSFLRIFPLFVHYNNQQEYVLITSIYIRVMLFNTTNAKRTRLGGCGITWELQ